MKERPQLSIVLATDSDATIRPVVERLRAQTVNHLVELVLVCPAPESMPVVRECGGEFASTLTVRHPVNDLAGARAAGVLAASAPLVFIGETHSFPHSDFAALTIAAFRDPQWSVVVPALRNANPRGVLSWSGFLCDYGMWAEELPEGEILTVPIYNATYRRSVLVELGERLPSALGQTDDLAIAMRERGRRAMFLPCSRVDHANTTQLWPWIANRFWGGLLIASNRSRGWSWTRRLVYVCGAFLLPAVLLPRILPGIRARKGTWPRGTMPAVVISLILRAGGELLGYAGLFGRAAEDGMLEIELHKLKYAVPRGPAR